MQNQTQKLIVAGAFLVKDGKILLALRHNASGDNGMYGLVGGKISMGEPIHAGLMREIEEEAGVKVRPEHMKFMHVISFKNENGMEIVSFDFMITAWEGEVVNKEPHKHTELAWFSLDNLPVNLLERHKDALEMYKKGEAYSFFGY